MRFLAAAFVSFAMPLSSGATQANDVERQVTDLVDALERGDRGDAVTRISGVFALVDDRPWVRTREGFVDLVLGCDASLLEASRSSFLRVHKYRWDCASGIYFASLAKHPENNSVEVIDPADEERQAQLVDLASRPVIPPPPPSIRTPPVDEQSASAKKRSRFLRALESTLLENSFSGVRGTISESTRFRLGYRDMSRSAFIAEMDADGFEAGQEQLAWIDENLGSIVSAECDDGAPSTSGYLSPILVCRARTSRPGHGFSVLLTYRDGALLNFETSYMNEDVFLLNREFIEGANTQ